MLRHIVLGLLGLAVVSALPTDAAPPPKRWSVGGVWVAPGQLVDDYHVYGLDWTHDEIKYYVDGVVTHGQGEVLITENLQVLTGEAEYGQPVIQRVFDIE